MDLHNVFDTPALTAEGELEAGPRTEADEYAFINAYLEPLASSVTASGT
jgi:hypothetical protein